MTGPATSGRIVYRGRKYALELLDRDGHEFAVLRNPGSVVVLPILPGQRVVMIRSERPAVGRTLWELPAGTLDPGESPDAAARRELEEETGYRAAAMTPLGRFYTSPGFTDELMTAFLGTELSHVGQRLEPDERLEVQPVTVEEAMNMIDSEELCDAKTIAALLLARRKGLI